MFLSLYQSECKTFCKMGDADGFARGETQNIFLGMLVESELDNLFEEEMDNVRREAIFHRYVFIYFIRLL